jgi:hypothetical protein
VRYSPLRSVTFRSSRGAWIGCRKGILERVVERLFLVFTRKLGAFVIALMRFFSIAIHFEFSDRAAQSRPVANNCSGAFVPRNSR